MSKKCAKCEKTVYPTEELKCLDKVKLELLLGWVVLDLQPATDCVYHADYMRFPLILMLACYSWIDKIVYLWSEYTFQISVHFNIQKNGRIQRIFSYSWKMGGTEQLDPCSVSRKSIDILVSVLVGYIIAIVYFKSH